MKAKAVQEHIRMSPRKIREVVYMLDDVGPKKALEMLPYLDKRAARPLEKVIRSAVANAKEMGANEDDLIFSEIQVTEGRTLKRGRPVSRGMWHPIMKRMSHIRVVLETKKEPKPKAEPEVKKEDKPKAKKSKKQ